MKRVYHLYTPYRKNVFDKNKGIHLVVESKSLDLTKMHRYMQNEAVLDISKKNVCVEKQILKSID